MPSTAESREAEALPPVAEEIGIKALPEICCTVVTALPVKEKCENWRNARTTSRKRPAEKARKRQFLPGMVINNERLHEKYTSFRGEKGDFKVWKGVKTKH